MKKKIKSMRDLLDLDLEMLSQAEIEELASRLWLRTADGSRSLISMRADFMFKAVVRDEIVASSLIEACLGLKEGALKGLEIVNPILDREHPEGKSAILDVKFKTAKGEIINIEMQLQKIVGILKRLVFYISRVYTDQIVAGEDYREMQKVHTVLLADFVLFPKDDDPCHKFQLYDKEHNIALDLLNLYIVELPKAKEGDNSTFYLWVRFIGASTKEEAVMLASQNPAMARALSIMERLSMNEAMRAQADAMEKTLRDIVTNNNYFREKGHKEGHKEGRKVGRAEGEKIGEERGLKKGEKIGEERGRSETKLEIVLNSLKSGLDINVIASITGLSITEIQSLAKKQ